MIEPPRLFRPPPLLSEVRKVGERSLPPTRAASVLLPFAISFIFGVFLTREKLNGDGRWEKERPGARSPVLPAGGEPLPALLTPHPLAAPTLFLLKYAQFPICKFMPAPLPKSHSTPSLPYIFFFL